MCISFLLFVSPVKAFLISNIYDVSASATPPTPRFTNPEFYAILIIYLSSGVRHD